MNLEDIRQWDIAALAQLEQALRGRLDTVADIQIRLLDIGRLPGWRADGAEAARRDFRITDDKLTDEAAVIGAVRCLAGETEEAVTHLKQVLDGVASDAAANGMSVRDDGGVVDVGPQPEITPEATAARELVREQLRAAARALILQAEDVDADAAAVLTKAAAGEISDRGATTVEAAGAAGFDQGGLTAPIPPDNGSPLQNREYWDALPDRQRQERLISIRTGLVTAMVFRPKPGMEPM